MYLALILTMLPGLYSVLRGDDRDQIHVLYLKPDTLQLSCPGILQRKEGYFNFWCKELSLGIYICKESALLLDCYDETFTVQVKNVATVYIYFLLMYESI